MAAEDNHQNKTHYRLILNDYEDTEHTFYLDLPPYSQKDKLLKFIRSSVTGWPCVSFSFSDGNFTGIENLFSLHLRCGYEDEDEEEFEEEVDNRLIVSMKFELKFVPCKVNLYNPITLNFARISFVNLAGPSSDADAQVVRFPVSTSSASLIPNEGSEYGWSQDAFLNWDSNYDGIKITINVSKETEVDIAPSNPMLTYPNSNVPLSKAGNTSFSEYFLSEYLSDCKVEVGEIAFPAHRFVLAKISGFCERMFSTDMIENRSRVWKIDDFDSNIVREFLEFSYTGTSENLKSANCTEILMDLYRMGHKYDVVLLKVQCEELLKNLINVENVVDLFHFGFRYESRSLAVAAKYQFQSFYKLQLLPNPEAIRELQKNYPDDMFYELIIK